jgi:preprotein translocase subunit SecA
MVRAPAVIEDIREGIHLQRYGGLEPLQEFHKQIVNTYGAMMEGLREEVVSIFKRLSARDGLVDLDRAGVRGPSSTWTYLVNDNPFSTFGVSLIAARNIGFSAGLGLVAVLSWPISIAVAASVFVRRWLRKR